MSLINDALKKAKQVQREGPSPLGAQHFRPVESGQRRFNLFFLMPVAVVSLSAVGGILLWVALQRHDVIQDQAVLARPNQPAVQQAKPQQSTIDPPVAARPAQAEATQNAGTAPHALDKSPPSEVSVAASAPSVASTQPNQNDQTAIGSPAQPPVATEPARPALPTLRGIYYNPSNPSAVLNSKTVYVGDHVSGFLVLEITLETVTVVKTGETNVLTLPD
jgi:cytoskeletal protein RodZ